jgi:hypothetical protein
MEHAPAENLVTALVTSGQVPRSEQMTLVDSAPGGNQVPRSRFTAAEIDEMVRIAAQCWQSGIGGHLGNPRANLLQARLAMRADHAVMGDPEPSDADLAQARGSGD